jgi:hypothetical protein
VIGNDGSGAGRNSLIATKSGRRIAGTTPSWFRHWHRQPPRWMQYLCSGASLFHNPRSDEEMRRRLKKVAAGSRSCAVRD